MTTRRAAARRGDQTLILLTMPFVAGLLVLIPDQPSRLLGLEFILTAGTFGVGLLLLDRRALTQRASTDHLSRTLPGLSPNPDGDDRSRARRWKTWLLNGAVAFTGL